MSSSRYSSRPVSWGPSALGFIMEICSTSPYKLQHKKSPFCIPCVYWGKQRFHALASLSPPSLLTGSKSMVNTGRKLPLLASNPLSSLKTLHSSVILEANYLAMSPRGRDQWQLGNRISRLSQAKMWISNNSLRTNGTQNPNSKWRKRTGSQEIGFAREGYAHLQDEEPIIVEIDPLPFQEFGDLCEAALLAIHIVVRLVASVRSSRDYKLGAWDDIVSLLPLPSERSLSDLVEAENGGIVAPSCSTNQVHSVESRVLWRISQELAKRKLGTYSVNNLLEIHKHLCHLQVLMVLRVVDELGNFVQSKLHEMRGNT